MTEPAAQQLRRRRGPFIRWPRATDALLGVLIVLGTLSVFVTPESATIDSSSVSSLPWHGYVLLAVAAVAVMWRRKRAIPVVFVEGAVVIAWSVLDYSGDVSLGLLIGIYSVGRYVADERWSYGVVIVAVSAALVSVYLDTGEWGQTALASGTTWVPWYVGRRIRARHSYMAMLEDRAVHLERERTALAERAVADERAAIARELHDVVAHRVSMMTVQAGAAKTIGADQPEDALDAVAAIEQEGRQALTELRHLLGVLRPDGSGESATNPQGAIAQIPDLVERMQDAGHTVRYSLDLDDPGGVPSQVGLSVYRVVQESLTNIVKHAGPETKVDVSISRHDSALEVEVCDDGTALSALPESGFGLAGMKERMSLLGGSLAAGPQAGGGWKVRAIIPVQEWQ